LSKLGQLRPRIAAHDEAHDELDEAADVDRSWRRVG
jgi:hypothetical protein